MKENLRHIQIVFGRSKCKFLQKETQYLGFIISERGIKADPDKVHVIRNMVPLKYVREVRSFIHM